MSHASNLSLAAEQPARSLLSRIQRVFAIVEIVLWVVFVLSIGFNMKHWNGSAEIMIIVASTLIMLYMALPFLVFGSQGWKRHIGSYLTGLAFAFAVAAFLFTILHWEGATEMKIVSFFPCLIGFIGTLIFTIINLRRNPDDRFYMFLMLRMLLGVLISGGAVVGMLN